MRMTTGLGFCSTFSTTAGAFQPLCISFHGSCTAAQARLGGVASIPESSTDQAASLGSEVFLCVPLSPFSFGSS